MAEAFRSTDGLCDALASASFDRPPALVSNAHITGLGVARALDAADVPVIALDRPADGRAGDGGSRAAGAPDARTGRRAHDGVAPPSTAVDYAGAVTYPLDDPGGFRADVERVVDAAGTEVVGFGCMDEWVHAYAGTEPDGVRLPFAGETAVERVLDKSSLYAVAEDLGIPYPETYRLSAVDPDEAVAELGFPLVLKPALKREFEEAVGTNVVEVADREEFDDVLAAAREAGVELMAQRTVAIGPGADRSFGSSVPPAGVADAAGVVGNATRSPRAYGTSCYVERAPHEAVRERALSVLAETGYHGISEAEFVYDREREEYLLLDVNTRPWKWIGLPVAAGVNLPLAAYASVTDATYEPDSPRDARWVYLPDYLRLAASGGGGLPREDWTTLASGRFESDGDLTTGLYRPSDPGPTAALLETEFSGREYYCSC